MNKLLLFILILFLIPVQTNPTSNLLNLLRNSLIKKSHEYGIRKLNIKTCEENLLLFNKIMNENSIFYWLSEGTALGVIRENRILPWDDDIDVSFNYEYRDIFIKQALPSLLLNGFIVAQVRQNKNFIALIRKNEKIDIDIVQKNGNCAALKTFNNNYNNECNNLIPYLKDIHQITFLNTNFNVPGVEYLEYLYGKTWNIPSKKK
jgi:hypothetical protein